MNRGPGDRGRGPHEGRSSRVNVRESDDQASAEHRRKLEALFQGGGNGGGAATPAPAPAPRQAPTERVFASPRRSLGRSPSDFRLRLERLRIAREVEEIREAGDQFLAHHQLPDEPDILMKLMLHPTERVNREAMGQISALLMQGRMTPTFVLDDRLKELRERATEPATLSYVQGIEDQVATLKAKG